MSTSSNPHAEAYDNVNQILAQAREFIAHELTGDQLSFIRTHIDANLRKIQNQLQAMGGAPSSPIAPVTGVNSIDQGPVTSILGQEITVRQPIKQSDVVISDNEKARFIARRQELLERLADDLVTDARLLEESQTPGAENVFRAAARKSGLIDYRDAPIDIDFIERMRASVRQTAHYEASVTDAENAVIRLRQSDDDLATAQQMLSDDKANEFNEDTEDPEAGKTLNTADAGNEQHEDVISQLSKSVADAKAGEAQTQSQEQTQPTLPAQQPVYTEAQTNTKPKGRGK